MFTLVPIFSKGPSSPLKRLFWNLFEISKELFVRAPSMVLSSILWYVLDEV